MDCMAAKALKSSFLSDAGGQQAFVDDVWCVTGLNNVTVAGDDFSVDDLLDFSDKEFKDGPLKEQDEEKESLSGASEHHRNSNFSSFSETDDFGLLLAGELTTPADNLENLEWLSQIVDDTQSEMSLLCPVGVLKDNKKGSFPATRSEPAVHVIRMAGFPIRVPVKARSKRSRPNGRVWTGSASLTSTESSTTTSSSSYGSSVLSPFVFSSPVHDFDMFYSVEKPAAKKQRRKSAADAGLFGMGLGSGFGSTGMIVSRRCSHCQVQKTPQWRTGPMGPKTLCNACGVRYKSGRLYPEYRPACSPTFSQAAHSNSHRKVLEMRRKKETVDHAEAGLSGLSAMVQTF